MDILIKKIKTKTKQKKGTLFILPPQEVVFVTKLSVARTEKQKYKVGAAIKHIFVIPEESGGLATPLSSA